MNELARALARRIRGAGPLSIAAYMAEALGNPEHGYYTTRDPLGPRGDFITAPEISQIFGELVGLWCADTWEHMGRPDPVILAEFGPGRGTLMEDALRALRVAPDFRRAIRLHLVEMSPVLREAQRAALGHASPSWHDTAASLPDGPLISIANEFIDALPIRQFVKSEKGWHERLVGLAADNEDLVFVLEPKASMGAEALIPRSLRAAPTGSLCEVSMAAASLARFLGTRLAAQTGAALFIDYGHFPSACGETFQALRRHRRHDVLADPGDADLTAHVDFAAFAAAANEAGAATWGPVSQGAFLKSLGLAERAARLLSNATPAQAAAIDAACRRLIDPAGMGTLFKVLALGNPALSAPAGFAGDQLL
ncbi:MAG TPA: SAM-dependent methyltransferase [Stellaceae bacterium]|nr:SAM-dependent methyltransferase [Stellaceae bacterium]